MHAKRYTHNDVVIRGSSNVTNGILIGYSYLPILGPSSYACILCAMGVLSFLEFIGTESVEARYKLLAQEFVSGLHTSNETSIILKIAFQK